MSNTISATMLADHLDRMVSIHGDLPVSQWDHDTGGIVHTVGQSVTFETDEDLGGVIVVNNAGYDWREPSIPASALSVQLREAAARFGDLTVHQRDADTSELMAFPPQTDTIRKGEIVIEPDGY